MAENTGSYEGIDTPWRRTPAELTERITPWIIEKFGPDARLENVHAPDNGMSSESLLFDVVSEKESGSFVARMAPLPSLFPVFENYDIGLQANAMKLAAERTSVPVPDVPFVELDDAWLGVPFLVMRRLPGVAPTDVPPYVFGGWVADMTEAERDLMERNSVRTLAELHTITVDNADLSFLERRKFGADPLDQHLGHERGYYEWARNGEHYPLIERTFEWLEANRPTITGPTVLNWGDARLGNMLFEGPVPTAVLDWEMVCVGPAGVDLAWMIFLHRFFQNLAETYGMPGLPDFMKRGKLAALYTEYSGQPVEALEWFEVFAALRFAIVSVRTSVRSIEYGQMAAPAEPDDLIMFRPLLEQMLAGTYWD